MHKLIAIIPPHFTWPFVRVNGLLIAVAILETAATMLIYPFINLVVNPGQIEMNGRLRQIYAFLAIDFLSARQLIVLLAFLMAGLYILKGLLKLVANRTLLRLVTRLQSELSSRLFTAFLHKPYAYFLQHNSSVIYRTVAVDVAQVTALVTNLLRVVAESAVALLMFGFLIYLNPLVSVIGIGVMGGAIGLINHLLTAKIVKKSQISRQKNIEMVKWILQSLGGLKNILVNRRQVYFAEQYDQHSREFARLSSQSQFLAGIPQLAVESLSLTGLFLLLGLAVLAGFDLGAMIPVLAAFALVTVRLMPAANRINASYNGMVNGYASIDAVYQAFFESSMLKGKTVHHAADNQPGHIPENGQERIALPLEIGICVENLSFKFPESPAWLFEDISMTIPAGQSVAFVGTTGSGKTTLADIILGLHHPQSGCVRVDGVDIRHDLAGWARIAGYIPQSVYLTDQSIRANVAFGYPADSIQDDWVWQCLADAQLKDFVGSLPSGLDTIVGERGIRLSGGQQQRLGIARALFLQPQFLVMDEATSSLDQETEQAIIETINRLAGTKTLLIVAHRPSTIASCNRVYRIENGQAEMVRSGP